LRLPRRRWADKGKRDRVRVIAAEAELAAGRPASALEQLRQAAPRWPRSRWLWGLLSRCPSMSLVAEGGPGDAPALLMRRHSGYAQLLGCWSHKPMAAADVWEVCSAPPAVTMSDGSVVHDQGCCINAGS
jgi:hypothetical protein